MEANLASLFELVADAVPDREAVVAGARRLTYRQLDRRADALAAWLGEAGVRAGDHVAVHLYNGSEYLETMLACFKLRAAPVNVNYRYVTEELRALLDDADAVAVVTEPDLVPLVDEARVDLPRVRVTIERGPAYERALAAHATASRPDPSARSGDDRYVLYTGGTTGPPRGVVWRHHDLFVAALGGGNPGGPPVREGRELVERARRGRARVLPACPFMHGTAHWMALATLLAGGTVVVTPGRSFDPARTWELVAAERVSTLVVVGDAFVRPLLDALSPARTAEVATLTAVLSGGAILSPSLQEDLERALPGVVVVDGYGASETGGQGRRVGSTGTRPHPTFTIGDETAVLDDRLQPVVPGSGVVGRVARRGHIPVGYHGDPERTTATFPVVDGERWVVTGDEATVAADGMLVLFGRGAGCINTGGEKVFPEEVEAVLKSHPAVFDTVVVGVPDTTWGERVAAVVAARPGADPGRLGADVVSHCRDVLAGYKVPRQVVLVDRVERSPSGKADYRWAKAVAMAATQESSGAVDVSTSMS